MSQILREEIRAYKDANTDLIKKLQKAIDMGKACESAAVSSAKKADNDIAQLRGIINKLEKYVYKFAVEVRNDQHFACEFKMNQEEAQYLLNLFPPRIS